MNKQWNKIDEGLYERSFPVGDFVRVERDEDAGLWHWQVFCGHCLRPHTEGRHSVLSEAKRLASYYYALYKERGLI